MTKIKINLKIEIFPFTGVLAMLLLFDTGHKANSHHGNDQGKTLEIQVEFVGIAPVGTAQYNLGKDFKGMASLSTGYEYSEGIKGNKFKLTLGNDQTRPYICFNYPASRPERQYRSYHIITANNYIFPYSGKINLKIFKDTVLFSGDGADLLRCQYEMFASIYSRNVEAAYIDNKRAKAVKDTMSSTYMSSYYNSLVELKDFYTSKYTSQLQVLDRYHKSIGEEVYNRLKYDTYGKTGTGLLNKLVFEIARGYASLSPVLRSTFLQFYKDQFWFNEIDTKTDSLSKMRSYPYSEFLYKKSFCNLFIPLMASGARLRPTPEQIYQQLLNDCPKSMLDFVIGNFFVSSSTKNSFSNWNYEDALGRVTDESVREVIQNMKMSRGLGENAYNFSLRDTSNHTVTLDDLKGKIVVLDFWYTGCTGCVALTEQMKPIIEHYRGNDNVLFVSISIDEDMDQWKKSINKGIYTHPGNLNLYTNGIGEEDAVIKHYGIRSYPTLLIIDEDGKLLSVNPTRPSSVLSSKSSQFMGIIDERLEKINHSK